MAAQSLLETHSPSRPRPATTTMRGLGHEHDFEPLRVEGHLSADLRGTLFRNGAVSAVRLDGASASGAVRITHTASLDADQQATRPRSGRR